MALKDLIPSVRPLTKKTAKILKWVSYATIAIGLLVAAFFSLVYEGSFPFVGAASIATFLCALGLALNFLSRSGAKKKESLSNDDLGLQAELLLSLAEGLAEGLTAEQVFLKTISEKKTDASEALRKYKSDGTGIIRTSPLKDLFDLALNSKEGEGLKDAKEIIKGLAKTQPRPKTPVIGWILSGATLLLALIGLVSGCS